MSVVRTSTDLPFAKNFTKGTIIEAKYCAVMRNITFKLKVIRSCTVCQLCLTQLFAIHIFPAIIDVSIPHKYFRSAGKVMNRSLWLMC